MQNGDEAWTSISPAGRGQLVKMLITLVNHMVNFVPILLTYTFQHCVATGMQNGDKALPKDSTATVNSGTALTNEPRREKTGLRGFRPGPTSTGLCSH